MQAYLLEAAQIQGSSAAGLHRQASCSGQQVLYTVHRKSQSNKRQVLFFASICWYVIIVENMNN